MIMKNYVILIGLFFIFSKASCTDSTNLKRENKVIGVYKSNNERELLFIDQGNRFYDKRLKSRNQDVIVPECDTLAKGSWKFISNGIVKLSNDSNFQKINFNIREEKKDSNDTIYIKVLMPIEDGFFEGRFAYNIHFECGSSSNFQSNKNLIMIPRNKIYDCKNNRFSFLIQDLSPDCLIGKKCYQRIFFNVFDDYKFKHDSNYFTITLNDFNQCFVEAMDVDDEFLFIDNNSIYWKGNVYKKQ